MTRLWNRLIRRGAGEEGFALITVMLIVMVMSLLAAVMVANLTSELSGVGRQRQVTTALGAADAGLDQLVFELQQSTNWTSFKTSYSTAGGAWWKDPSIASGNPNFGWWGLGKGRYRAHIDCSPSNDCTINPNDQLITIEGQYPAGTGPIRTIQAVVRRSAPQALTFALFADRGFDEHHHGSSWVTPTIITTKLHSNGYVKRSRPPATTGPTGSRAPPPRTRRGATRPSCSRRRPSTAPTARSRPTGTSPTRRTPALRARPSTRRTTRSSGTSTPTRCR